MPLVKLRAQGYQVLVVSPDPVKFELSYLPKSRNVDLASRVIAMERKLLFQRVHHAGIQVLEWDVRDPFDQVVKRKLSHPPAWVRTVGR
jgi:predicted methyltransferase